MKRTISFFLALTWCFILNAQKFQTTMKSVGNTVEIYLRPDATGSVSFSDIEFYIRYASTDNLLFSNFQAGTSAFPGISFNDNNLTPADREVGFKSIKIGFIPPATPTTATSYTSGQEYKICSFKVTGSMASANLQLVHEVSFDPYYMALTNDLGADIAPVSLSNYFYPSTSTSSSGGKTFYYYQLSDIVLPLSLLDFTAQSDNKTAFLTWQTSEERNLSHYEIEKSIDGKSWNKVGQVKSTRLNNYQFSDDKAFIVSTSIFYRLRMVDSDGSFRYSPIRQLQSDRKLNLIVFPNPSQGVITVQGVEDNETWTIMDVSGRTVATFKGQREINLYNYSQGVYSIRTEKGKMTQFVISY